MSLPTFIRVSDCVSMYQPDSVHFAKQTTCTDPDVVLLFGWLQADLRNVAKYTEGYKRLYPSARIVLVTSSMFDIVRSTGDMQQRMQTAIDIIYDSENMVQEGLLVHALSNGGAYNLEAACRAHRSLYGAALSPRALILDSTPGSDNVWSEFGRGVDSFTVALPQFFIARYIGKFFIVLLLGIVFVLPALCGQKNIVSTTRSTLNDSLLLAKSTYRCYIYSRDDKQIGWEAVEAHATEADLKGWKVTKVEFQDSKHVAHLKADPELYWSSISSTWAAAVMPALIQ